MESRVGFVASVRQAWTQDEVKLALPRLDQRMLEDMSEPHMLTIHENARVDPLTVDDPWSRACTSNYASCMSMDNDLSRSRT
eukprot:4265436-Amphidinium_carterae.2